jgi:hypothetical protein
MSGLPSVWRLIMIAWLPVFLSGVLSLSPATTGRETSDAPTPYGALLHEPLRRVRSVDPQVIALILEGLKRSNTFADLVAAVNASDVIVYIQRVNQLAPTIAGQLVIVPVPHEQRYLRIQIINHLSPNETIALIGHELRHALEVAAAPEVRDQRGLMELYQRIGEPGGRVHSYDTRAAQNTGRRVRNELAG